jgi:hypothetical protein
LIPNVVFKTHVLDSVKHTLLNVIFRCYDRKRYPGGEDRFWHSYLVYRVKTEKNPRNGRLVEIRRTAELACKENGLSLEVNIDTLSWLAFGLSQNHFVWTSRPREQDLKLNMLVVAAQFNLQPLAERLLRAGASPCGDNALFPIPIRIAAQRGNTAVLDLFQRHIDGRIEQQMITGAALNGDLALFERALYPPCLEPIDRSKFGEQPVGDMDRQSAEGRCLLHALLATPHPAISERIEELMGLRGRHRELTERLCKHAKRGNMEMVDYLLDQGALVNGARFGKERAPLTGAASRGHYDVVKLLLDAGANPGYRGACKTPLARAATLGNIRIVRLLLDRGADIDLCMKHSPISCAVKAGHVEVVRLLLDRGVKFEKEIENLARLGFSVGSASFPSSELQDVPPKHNQCLDCEGLQTTASDAAEIFATHRRMAGITIYEPLGVEQLEEGQVHLATYDRLTGGLD